MSPRLEVLTNTILNRRRRCEELFRLSVLERLERPSTRPARPVGSAFHHGIEHRDPTAAGDYLRKAAAGQLWTNDEREGLETWVAIVEAMVGGALALWTDWPTVQESVFETPIVNPATGARSTRHRMSGRIDGEWDFLPHAIGSRHIEVASWPEAGWDYEDGTPAPAAILELKTTGRLDRDFIQRLSIAAQPTSYLEAASYDRGRDVRVAVYRIAKKPGLRPHRGETDEEYRQRSLDRKPLAPLKPKTLKKAPAKGIDVLDVDDLGFVTSFRRGELVYGLVEGLGYVESDESIRTRETARERDRAPLRRKVAEAPADFRERIRADYLARPEFYFAEVIVTRTEEQMERWRHEAWEEHLRILRIENGGMTVRNDNSCLDFGRCDFLDLCTGQVGVEVFNVRPHVNPELENS